MPLGSKRDGSRTAPGGTKWRAPYNEREAWKRQEEYYDKKKMYAKFQRCVRYEEKQEQLSHEAKRKRAEGDGVASLRRRAMKEDAEDLEAEYERRLELSFGSGGTEAALKETGATPEDLWRRNRKRKRGAAEAPGDSSVAGGSAGDASGGKKSAETDTGGGSATGAATGKKKKKKVSKDQGAAGDGDANAAEGAEKPAREVKGKGKGKGKVPGGEDVPLRFRKEARQHREAQEAKVAEQQKREEEIAERKRVRKRHDKERIKKGLLLSDRTRSGQPRMQGRMDDLLKTLNAKVTRDKGGDSGKQKR